mgnify:FL=1
MVVVLLREFVLQNVPQNLHQSLSHLLEPERLGQHQTVQHTHPREHHRRLVVPQRLQRQPPHLPEQLRVVLVDVVQHQVALPSYDRRVVLQQLAQLRYDVHHQIRSQEVPQQRKRSHHYKSVLALQVLGNGVVHEQPQLVAGLDQQGRQQVGHLLQVEVRRLAEVDRQDVREGSVVPQRLEVHQLHQDVRVLLCVEWALQLRLD